MFWKTKQPIPSGLLQELTKKQNELSKKVILKPFNLTKLKVIAGCDSSFVDENTIFSVFVNFSYPDLQVLDFKYSYSKVPLPYIPGFLAFREVPNILKTWDMLEAKPDLTVVDGHGIAHPRGLGIASHLGALLDIPTIGVAKNLLVGKYESLGNSKGSFSPIIYKDKHLGYALRAKDNVKPVFVSPGHLITAEQALSIIIATMGKYRLPEVTRIADKYTKEKKKELRIENEGG